MGYPTTGKRLEYIQSTVKSAYLNLGFHPNQDTKVVLVASIPKSSITFAVGNTSRNSPDIFMIRTFSANSYWCVDYGDAYIQMPETSVTMGKKTTFVLDRNVCTIGGFTVTVPSSEGITFESGEMLLLAGVDTSGKRIISYGTIWGCQVFDNGTLVRDCIPWELEDGSVGLWDIINDVFYGSVGTTQFTAGYIADALPDGCTEVDFIRSTGSEYINTNVTPTGNTRLVMNVKVLGTQVEDSYVFGMMHSGSFYWSVQFNDNLFSTRYATEAEVSFSSALTTEVFHTIDKNKNICTIGDEVVTNTATDTSGNAPIFLFARSRVGSSADRFCKVEAKSCRIFENDVPIHDLVTIRNANGELGFYDLITGTIFLNAGSGAFETGEIVTTGKGHGVLINGVRHQIMGGNVLISGISRQILKGRTLINGVGYDIPFGRPISEVPVGDSVYMTVNGVTTEFIVVHQGNPDSSVYDSSCDDTWLLMKDIYTKLGNGATNEYKDSPIDTYLNDTFLNLLDSDIIDHVKTVTIPYSWVKTDSDGIGYEIKSSITTKMFLLSCQEVGWSKQNNSYFTDDGAVLDYFRSCSEVDSKRIAYLNGTATNWWLRSPQPSDMYYAWYVQFNGGHSDSQYRSEQGIRPAMIVYGDTLVDVGNNIIEGGSAEQQTCKVYLTGGNDTGAKIVIDGKEYIGTDCPVLLTVPMNTSIEIWNYDCICGYSGVIGSPGEGGYWQSDYGNPFNWIVNQDIEIYFNEMPEININPYGTNFG